MVDFVDPIPQEEIKECHLWRDWFFKLSKRTVALNNGIINVPKYTTTEAASLYVEGNMYYDTTLGKLRIGGATAWETVQSI